MEKKLNLRRTVRSKKLTRKAPGKKVKSKKKFQKGRVDHQWQMIQNQRI